MAVHLLSGVVIPEQCGTASKILTNTLIPGRKQRPLPLVSGCLRAKGPVRPRH